MNERLIKAPRTENIQGGISWISTNWKGRWLRRLVGVFEGVVGGSGK